MVYLRSIARILEVYCVIRVQRYVPLPSTLMKQVLGDVKHADVAMVTSLGKNIEDFDVITRFPHQIIQNDQRRCGSVERIQSGYALFVLVSVIYLVLTLHLLPLTVLLGILGITRKKKTHGRSVQACLLNCVLVTPSQ